MFGLVNSPSGPWERVTTSHHGSQVPLFLLSYRDSTFLSIFAVPNNAVFWITSNLTFTPIRFMYSLKLLFEGPTENRLGELGSLYKYYYYYYYYY